MFPDNVADGHTNTGKISIPSAAAAQILEEDAYLAKLEQDQTNAGLTGIQRFLKRLSQLAHIFGSGESTASSMGHSTPLLQNISAMLSNVWNPLDTAMSGAQLTRDAYQLHHATTSRAKRIALLILSILAVLAAAATVFFTFHAMMLGLVAGAPLFFAVGTTIAAIRAGFLFSRTLNKMTHAGLLADREGSCEKIRAKYNITNDANIDEEIAIACQENNQEKAKQLYRLRRLELQATALRDANNPSDDKPWKQKLREELFQHERTKAVNRFFKTLNIALFAVGFAVLCAPPVAPFAAFVLAPAAAILIGYASIKYCIESYNDWRVQHAKERLSANCNEKSIEDSCLKKLTAECGSKEEAKCYWRALPPAVRQQKINEQWLASEKEMFKPENRGGLIRSWLASEFLAPQPQPKNKQETGFFAGLKDIFSKTAWVAKKVGLCLIALPILVVSTVYSAVDAAASSTSKPADKEPTINNENPPKPPPAPPVASVLRPASEPIDIIYQKAPRRFRNSFNSLTPPASPAVADDAETTETHAERDHKSVLAEFHLHSSTAIFHFEDFEETEVRSTTSTTLTQSASASDGEIVSDDEDNEGKNSLR